MIPVFAVAIIVYEANSMTKDTRAILRSKRGEESLFPAIRLEGSAFAWVDGVCGGSCGTSGSSVTGGRGVVRVDGLESRIRDGSLLNKEIIAG